MIHVSEGVCTVKQRNENTCQPSFPGLCEVRTDEDTQTLTFRWGTLMSCKNDVFDHMIHGIYEFCFTHTPFSNTLKDITDLVELETRIFLH